MVNGLRARCSVLARVGVALVGGELVVGGLLHDPLRLHAQLVNGWAGAVGVGALLVTGAASSGRSAHRRTTRTLLVDPLTGAGTRSAVVRSVDRELARGAGDVIVLRVDLDGLAELHGTLGPDAVDEVLRQVAGRLTDLAPTGWLGRLDGASFVLARADLTGEIAAIDAAVRVRDALHRPIEVAGLPLGVQARVGVAVGPVHGGTADDLLRRADLAAQRARRGPDHVVVFEPAHERPTPERLALVADLRRALDDGGLALEYQPVVHLPTGRVAAVEALLRWTHPTLGALPADEVIELAEHSALIGPLTRWVLDEALRQCNVWCDMGTYLSVSVNVSARCLDDESFADDVECAMLRHGVPPHLLEIELTESAVPDDTALARRVLGRLHRLGVTIAVDGFGTGHASLAYLQTLPVDTLKIDATFVAELGHRPGDGTIVRAIVALGRSLGLQVVAAGVADDRAERFLLDVGCDLGQGFRWARPMRADDALAWARAAEASHERNGRNAASD